MKRIVSLVTYSCEMGMCGWGTSLGNYLTILFVEVGEEVQNCEWGTLGKWTPCQGEGEGEFLRGTCAVKLILFERGVEGVHQCLHGWVKKNGRVEDEVYQRGRWG